MMDAPELKEADRIAIEAYQIGYQEGYEEAVQIIDRSTGGDGEYFASNIPGEGCPDAASMIAKIVDRVEWDRTPDPRVTALVEAAARLTARSLKHTKLGERWVLSQLDLEALETALAAFEGDAP
jgi:hypothetical protein